MNLIKKIGTYFLLSYGVFFFNTPFAMDPSDEDTLKLLMEMSNVPGPQKRKKTAPITLDLTLSDSEDSIDEILLNLPKHKVPLNRLKRKREENNELPPDDSLETQSDESSQEPALKRFKTDQQIETEVLSPRYSQKVAPSSTKKRSRPHLISSDCSQEDSFDQILLDMPTREVPLKPLKRKRRNTKELPSDDSQATQSIESSQEPDSISTSQLYTSEEENSLLADGEHYGSDEESPYQTELSYSHDYEA